MGIETTAGVLYSPGGIGASFATGIGVEVKPLRYWSIMIEGTYAPYPNDFIKDNRATTFDSILVRGFIFREAFSGNRMRWGLGAGAGVVFAWTNQVNGSTSARTQVAWLGGAGRLHVTLTRFLAFTTETRIGATVPEVEVRFNDTAVAHFGRPLLELSIGLEWMFL